MAWEIEYEHVDLAEMEHVTGFIERTVRTRDGQPARHILKILLGADGLSSTRGTGSSNLTLTTEGELKTAKGESVDVRALQLREMMKLNGLHQAARAYAKKHNLPHQPAGRRP